MTTTTPSPSITSTSLTTPTVTVPQFTPDAGCFDSDNIWYQETACGSDGHRCGYFHLADDQNYGSLSSHKTCWPEGEPEQWPQTVCPHAYTPVSSAGYDGGSGTSGTTTSTVQVVCCPTAQDFRYKIPSVRVIDGVTTATLGRTCVVSTPSFTGLDGSPTLTVRAWASENRRGEYPLATITTTYDHAMHVLVAEAVTISYAVVEVNSSSTRTCAPDCDTPWTGGDWPLPTEALPEQTQINDSPLRDMGKSLGMLIGIPVAAVVVLVILLVVCCKMSKKSSRRKKEAAERLGQGQGTTTTGIEAKV